MTLGERIKKLRKERGLTLVELANVRLLRYAVLNKENNKSKSIHGYT